jgi:hypothetical protein
VTAISTPVAELHRAGKKFRLSARKAAAIADGLGPSAELGARADAAARIWALAAGYVERRAARLEKAGRKQRWS